ncbi:MAG: cysteine hydrolase [Candidatus Margulisiibacteriota bacterium]|nr:MAG: hypothetical protein A2X43_09955 [Candidatus Margulisbacteria bacterium GWD2_39_127]OGI05457.1 MAG: hypothetical protein A2X42_11780 [Candidatus Margulisbacteria bacterium GWF2_38_17]OGI07676.1 MAG: hypothetical protein A2X41_04565 [Candidatus Margulisbacteria bacterium GWE2_39_32]PZM77214.1 MAG: cysteine hydrolase [Candidatus Margulisiibacteriota bacterium]HAR61904.1 cysteine hydrolase [Candidatus Margulisiibacteriota bacterium]
MDLKKKNTALLIIDVQIGLFRKKTPIYSELELLKNITTLITRSRTANIPIIFVQHSNKSRLIEDSDDWQIHPQLACQSSDVFIRKQHGSAFEETSLQNELDQKQISTLVITGIVTHGCVRATCYDAIKLGYEVVLAQDAHSGFNQDDGVYIEEWNAKFAAENIVLMPTESIYNLL